MGAVVSWMALQGQLGALTNMMVSYNAFLTVLVCMLKGIAAGWVDCVNPVVFEICGTQGHALVMNGELYFQSSQVEGSTLSLPLKDLPEALPHAFDLFLDKLEGKEAPLVSAKEAAERSIVMEALYKANEKGGFVKI